MRWELDGRGKMSMLATQTLRKEFKENIDLLIERALQPGDIEALIPEIQRISEHLEKVIREKVLLLEKDFHDHPLSGDYLRTVTEGFDDLDRLLRSSKTFADTVRGKSQEEILVHIKAHYAHNLIPLLNIMAKLENDYVSIATQTISRKQESLSTILRGLHKLKIEEQNTKHSVLVLNKKRRLTQLETSVKRLDLLRKMTQMSLLHDRLNLYYFNNDHPVELREIKQRVDLLRNELKKFGEDSFDVKNFTEQ